MVSAPYMFTGDNVGDSGLVKRIGVGTLLTTIFDTTEMTTIGPA